jgi:hypothetical protein
MGLMSYDPHARSSGLQAIAVRAARATEDGMQLSQTELPRASLSRSLAQR